MTLSGRAAPRRAAPHSAAPRRVAPRRAASVSEVFRKVLERLESCSNVSEVSRKFLASLESFRKFSKVFGSFSEVSRLVFHSLFTRFSLAFHPKGEKRVKNE
jgi:hypothetical protein